MVVDRRVVLVAALVVVFLLSTVLAGASMVEQPRITRVDNEWGAVTENRTEVETRLAIANPTLLRLGDRVATVNYSVSLNGIRVANETDRSVNVSDGGTVVHASTSFDNDEMQAWWVSHVARDETTTVSVDPTVRMRYGGVELWRTAATRTETVETDVLAPLRSDRRRTFDAYGRTVLVVEETDARWGEPTAARTPIDATATVRNPTWLPIPLTTIEYTVRMNGVVVGRGDAAGRTVVRSGETRTIDARAVIDNERLDEWWATHLRRGERTRMTVDFHAVVELNGRERRIRLDFLSSEHTFETDVLGESAPLGDASAVDG